jgi:hypothetical protein
MTPEIILLTIDILATLIGLSYIVRVEHEVAADLRRTNEAYGAGNLRQGLKVEELIEQVRNEMHAERGSTA